MKPLTLELSQEDCQEILRILREYDDKTFGMDFAAYGKQYRLVPEFGAGVMSGKFITAWNKALGRVQRA